MNRIFKTMSSILTMMTVAAVATMSLTACSDDDDDASLDWGTFTNKATVNNVTANIDDVTVQEVDADGADGVIVTLYSEEEGEINIGIAKNMLGKKINFDRNITFGNGNHPFISINSLYGSADGGTFSEGSYVQVETKGDFVKIKGKGSFVPSIQETAKEVLAPKKVKISTLDALEFDFNYNGEYNLPLLR